MIYDIFDRSFRFQHVLPKCWKFLRLFNRSSVLFVLIMETMLRIYIRISIIER